MKHVAEKTEVKGVTIRTNIVLLDGLVTLQKESFHLFKKGAKGTKDDSDFNKKGQFSYGIKVMGLIEAEVIQPNLQPALTGTKSFLKNVLSRVYRVSKVEASAAAPKKRGRKAKVAPVTA